MQAMWHYKDGFNNKLIKITLRSSLQMKTLRFCSKWVFIILMVTWGVSIIFDLDHISLTFWWRYFNNISSVQYPASCAECQCFSVKCIVCPCVSLPFRLTGLIPELHLWHILYYIEIDSPTHKLTFFLFHEMEFFIINQCTFSKRLLCRQISTIFSHLIINYVQ